MDGLGGKIDIHIKLIAESLSELPKEEDFPELSRLEINGVATLLHNFYNGVENILKLRLRDFGVSINSGPSWHKELMSAAVANGIVSPEIEKMLRPYLGFRHHFSNNYALHLDVEKLRPLVRNVFDVWGRFEAHITSN